MRRPAMQFYTGDWQGNAKLRRCTHAERGIWINVLCLMHDSDEYGVLRWPLRDIAQAVGCKVSELQSLRTKQVLKGGDHGEEIAELMYTPRHAGKDGDPVVLIPAQAGPLWYSSRMVRDEYIRAKRGEATRFEAEPKATPNLSPKPPIGEAPTGAPTAREGDGPSTSTSSSYKPVPTANAVGAPDGAPALPDCPHEKIITLYHEILPTHRRVLVWNKERRKLLRARWLDRAMSRDYTTEAEGLAWWRRYFEYVAKAPFLTGQVAPRPGHTIFIADLQWLITSNNFVKVLEGKYHDNPQGEHA